MAESTLSKLTKPHFFSGSSLMCSILPYGLNFSRMSSSNTSGPSPPIHKFLLLGPVSSSRCSRLAWSRVSACTEWVGATWRNVSNQSAGMPWKTASRPRGGARYLAPSDAKLLASKIGTLMGEVVVRLHRRVEVGIDNECAVLVRDHL